jgi:hypothetical protein
MQPDEKATDALPTRMHKDSSGELFFTSFANLSSGLEDRTFEKVAYQNPGSN